MSRAKNRSEKRRLLRRRLEAQGYSTEQIERIVAQREVIAAEQYQLQGVQRRHDEQEAQLDRERATREREQDALWARLNPDDTAFRPRSVDKLRIGVARVSGTTARVVARRTTITRYQHDEIERKP